MTRRIQTTFLFAAIALVGCGEDGGGNGNTDVDAGTEAEDASGDVTTGDTGTDAESDATTDIGEPDTSEPDGVSDTGDDADADTSVPDAETDVTPDTGDAGVDGGTDTGTDTGSDARVDTGTDSGMDAGDVIVVPPEDRTDDLFDPLLGSWSEDFGVAGMSGDFGGQVYTTLYDIDTDVVYAAGNFTNAGGEAARNIAVWDGLTWAPVGDGLGISVNALAIDETDGTLYAAGSGGGGFIPTPSFVYAWDGTRWEPLGSELPMFTQVNGLTFFDGELVALGNFDGSWSGQAGMGVWDGSAWVPVSDGDGAFEVNTAIVYEGEFCVGGGFTEIDGIEANNIACFDGDVWSPLGEGFNSFVEDLEIDGDGTLYAGGWFNIGDSGVGIATFDGTNWNLFEGGVAGGLTTKVRDIVITDAAVYVGGQFGAVGGEIPAGNIAAFVDGSWRGMSGGVVNRVGISIEPGVFSMTVDFEGGLYVGGDFSEAGGVASNNYAYWDGTMWSVVYDPSKAANGISGVVEALAAGPDGTIYAGGSFTSAGSASALNIAAFNGAVWEEVGIGIEGGIRTLAVDPSGTLWVGGSFTGIGPESASNLAYYDGVVFRAATESPDGPVEAIGMCSDGTMFVTGEFTSAGDTTLNRVGVYDPESGWSALGSGLGGDGFWRVPAVTCLEDGTAYVGGGFATAGGEAIPNLAYWAGTGWEPVGDSPDDNITALDWYDGVLYAGGGFTAFGDTPAVGAAAWDGTSWEQMGEGLGTEFDFSRGESVDLIAKENGVFATGFITRSGETVLGFVGWFDGTEWHDLDGGVDDLTSAGIVDDGRLIIGGPFTNAGGVPSLGIAMWNYMP